MIIFFLNCTSDENHQSCSTGTEPKFWQRRQSRPSPRERSPVPSAPLTTTHPSTAAAAAAVIIPLRERHCQTPPCPHLLPVQLAPLMRHRKVAGSDLWTDEVLTSCFGSVSKTTNQDLRVFGCGRSLTTPEGDVCACVTIYQHTITQKDLAYFVVLSPPSGNQWSFQQPGLPNL